MPNTSDARLEAHEITVQFRGLTALSDVSLTLEPGLMLGVIGPNGAGKTTLVNVLTGHQKPTAGHLSLGTRDITARSPDAIARNGVARTFQNVRLFKHLTVWDNVAAGAVGAGKALLRTNDATADVLQWMGIRNKAHLPAASLPYGDQRMVGVARALTMSPQYLLLDEPAAGLNEAEGDMLARRIEAIPARFGCGVLLIEHNMRVVMQLCTRLHVLDGGRTLATGDSHTVRHDPAVVEAYLGTAKDSPNAP